MARIVEALNEYVQEKGKEIAIFLGGGISGCCDWQTEIIKHFMDLDNVVLLNPRRANFPMDDPMASMAQIKWEFHHLRRADAILFWFPSETLCPITLYELGAWSMTNVPLFVGCHPDYRRAADVSIQTGLIRPDVEVVYDMEDLTGNVRLWIKRAMAKASEPSIGKRGDLMSDYEILTKWMKYSPEAASKLANELKEKRESLDRHIIDELY